MQPAMPLMVACVRLSSTTASENQAAASRNDAAPADTAAAACQAKEVPRMSETPFVVDSSASLMNRASTDRMVVFQTNQVLAPRPTAG
jgi:hypothetical protein